MLSRLHTSKFSLTSSDLANFICWCVKKNMSIFSLTSALVKEKRDTLQNLLVCTGRQGKLVKKIEKLRAHTGLVLVMTYCNGYSENLLIRSQQQIRLDKAKLVKEDFLFIHMSI